MQRLWYYFLKTYVRTGLHFYFRKIIVQGSEKIPAGPVMFAANHQNAFMDALLIVCFNSHFTHFLARADIFKNPFSRWLLSTMNLIPVYRIRDGWQSLRENQHAFAACHELFKKKDAIVIFPEGNHGSQRRVRPLTKGFARIALESLQKDPDLKISIVPVGLNYSNPSAFRGDVSIIFGDPILISQQTISISSLRDELASRMRALTTHVEDSVHYNQIVEKLSQSQPNYLDPAETNRRIAILENGGTLPAPTVKANSAPWIGVRILSAIINFLPLVLWNVLRGRIKDPVFVTSMRFGVGIFLFPIFYLTVAILIFFSFGWLYSVLWALLSFPSMLVHR